MSNREAAGQVADVVTRIRGSVGPGEVRVLLHGCYETMLAYSDSYIERGEKVLVITHRGSGMVDVVPWPMTTLITGPESGAGAGVNERQ